nr:transposase family protein [Haloechinothrix sp. LS1_15]
MGRPCWGCDGSGRAPTSPCSPNGPPTCTSPCRTPRTTLRALWFSTARVFSADRCGEQSTSVTGTQIDAWYSGKAHQHSGNIHALVAPGGRPLWVSDVEPGSVHDITATRDHVLAALSWAASKPNQPTLADSGYAGASIGVHTPVKQPTDYRRPDVDNRTDNALLRGLRALGERGFATLTGRWPTLHHITPSPRKIDRIVKAALILTHAEHGRPA